MVSKGGAVKLEIAHLVFLQHHEIEMLNPLFCILTHAFLERSGVNNVSNILVYEGIPAKGNKISLIVESEMKAILR